MNAETKQSANILVMDDEPNNLSILRQMLTLHGYKVRPVLSGELALQAVVTVVPDLILLDIMMVGGINGYEVCRELKKMETVRDIPVIFLSALDDVANKVKAFQTGGVDYITKPFSQEEVLARVETHLTLHRVRKTLKFKNARLEKLNGELKQALEEIRTLRGILPICAKCKKIRDDQGYWNQIEVYIRDHTEVDFSHGICPSCAAELYPGLDLNP